MALRRFEMVESVEKRLFACKFALTTTSYLDFDAFTKSVKAARRLLLKGNCRSRISTLLALKKGRGSVDLPVV